MARHFLTNEGPRLGRFGLRKWELRFPHPANWPGHVVGEFGRARSGRSFGKAPCSAGLFSILARGSPSPQTVCRSDKVRPIGRCVPRTCWSPNEFFPTRGNAAPSASTPAGSCLGAASPPLSPMTTRKADIRLTTRLTAFVTREEGSGRTAGIAVNLG